MIDADSKYDSIEEMIADLYTKKDITSELIVIRLSDLGVVSVSSTLTDANIMHLFDRIKFQMLSDAMFRTDLKKVN